MKNKNSCETCTRKIDRLNLTFEIWYYVMDLFLYYYYYLIEYRKMSYAFKNLIGNSRNVRKWKILTITRRWLWEIFISFRNHAEIRQFFYTIV